MNPCLTSDDEDPGMGVFAEHYEVSDDEFEGAVRAVLWNLLGERSVTLDIGWLQMGRLRDLTPGERSKLMKLQKLPAYLERRRFSSLCINEQGKIEEGK